MDSWISKWWSGTLVHRCWFYNLRSWMVGHRSMASEQVYDGIYLDRLSLIFQNVLFLSSSSSVTFSTSRLFSWKIAIGSKIVLKSSPKCSLKIFSVQMAIEPAMVRTSFRASHSPTVLSSSSRLEIASCWYLSGRIGESRRCRLETKTTVNAIITFFQYH